MTTRTTVTAKSDRPQRGVRVTRVKPRVAPPPQPATQPVRRIWPLARPERRQPHRAGQLDALLTLVDGCRLRVSAVRGRPLGTLAFRGTNLPVDAADARALAEVLTAVAGLLDVSKLLLRTR
jgi:hypothetical protein